MRLASLLGALFLMACATSPAAPNAPLAGLEARPWALVEMSGQRAVPNISSLTLRDGRAFGGGGCSGFDGSYIAHDSHVTISQIQLMALGCGRPPPRAAMEQEAHYLAALVGTFNVSFQGDNLIVRREDGVTLRFAPAPNR